MGTENQKYTIDTHTNKKQSKHNTKDSHQIIREQKRQGRKKAYKNKSKTLKKMAPTKRYRQAEWIQKQDICIYAVYKRPTSDLGTHTD